MLKISLTKQSVIITEIQQLMHNSNIVNRAKNNDAILNVI